MGQFFKNPTKLKKFFTSNPIQFTEAFTWPNPIGTRLG